MMMYSFAALAFVLLTLTGSETYGYQPQCILTRGKPCQIRTDNRRWTGEYIEGTVTDLCSCGAGTRSTCGWNNPTKTIHSNLFSTETNMTMSMAFCNRVVPPNLCAEGDVAVTLRGNVLLPNRLFAYRCRCTGDQPLVLKTRELRSDFHAYHDLICADHQPTCYSASSPCYTITATSVTYNCQCPSGTVCRATEDDDPNSPTTNGYCQNRD